MITVLGYAVLLKYAGWILLGLWLLLSAWAIRRAWLAARAFDREVDLDREAERECLIIRANQTAATVLPSELKFHALRHTYASLCVAAGIKPAKLSGRMGHANVRTTLDVYVHLFPDDDATEDMAALGALAAPKSTYTGNVVPLHG